MIRFLFSAVLLVCVASDVAEARGRNRVMRHYNYPTQSQYQTQSHYQMGYSSGTVQTMPVGSSQQSSTPSIRTVSYQSPNGMTVSHGGSMQAWAEDEARMMAERGTCGHIRSAPPGYFVGVGCGMTCMGSGTLVAEANYQGKMVRVWQR